MLTIAAVAVAMGARSMTAIGEWAADAPQWMLKLVGARFHPRHHRFVAPGEATVRRALTWINGDALDTAISAWILDRTPPATPDSTDERVDPAPLVAVAVDGKTPAGHGTADRRRRSASAGRVDPSDRDRCRATTHPDRHQ